MINNTTIIIEESKRLTATDVRYLCIEKEWYDLGTNDDYSSMLQYVKDNGENVTGNAIYNIAKDIVWHTNDDLDVNDVMFELGKLVSVHYEKAGYEGKRYIMEYHGYLFHGDCDGINRHSFDDWDRVQDIINAYGDDDNLSMYVMDTEHEVTWHKGEWY